METLYLFFNANVYVKQSHWNAEATSSFFSLIFIKVATAQFI